MRRNAIGYAWVEGYKRSGVGYNLGLGLIFSQAILVADYVDEKLELVLKVND